MCKLLTTKINALKVPIRLMFQTRPLTPNSTYLKFATYCKFWAPHFHTVVASSSSSPADPLAIKTSKSKNFLQSKKNPRKSATALARRLLCLLSPATLLQEQEPGPIVSLGGQLAYGVNPKVGSTNHTARVFVIFRFSPRLAFIRIDPPKVVEQSVMLFKARPAAA